MVRHACTCNESILCHGYSKGLCSAVLVQISVKQLLYLRWTYKLNGYDAKPILCGSQWMPWMNE